MRHRYLHSASAIIVAVVGAVGLGWAPAAGPTSLVSFVGVAEASGEGAQVPTAAKATWDPPRTPDGQPDIQGYWTNLEAVDKPNFFSYSLTGEGAEEHDRIAQRGERRYDSIVIAPGGKIPYQPWALAKREELLANHLNPKKLEHVDTRMRCIPTGAPRLLYSSGAPQILQTPGYVLMLHEWNHAYRIIRLDGTPHLEAGIELWAGDSRGRWEGNTLVVDATNAKPGWLDNSGNFYGENMHVVERWTLVDRNTIRYDAAVEDPTMFTSPWKLAFTMTRRNEPDYELLEEACHEGNVSIQHIFPEAWMSKVPR